MPSDNLILFGADIWPCGSRKLQDGRPKQSSESKGGGRMVKTHFGNLASPPLLLRVPVGSNERGFGRVNHFLQVVNSQGRQDESDVCVQIKWRHRSNTFGRKSCCFSLTLVLERWKTLAFEVPIRQIHRVLHLLNEVINAGDADHAAA